MRRRHRHLNARDLGAKLVLDARHIDQSDNTAVSTWADRSGNGWDATQGTAANQPTFQTAEFGGNGVVRFDGSNDFLALSGGGLDLLKNVSGAAALVSIKYTTTSGVRIAFLATVGNSTAVRFGVLANVVSGQLHGNARRIDGNAGAGLNAGAFSANDILLQFHNVDYVGGTQVVFKNGTQEGNNSLASSGGNTSNTASQEIVVGNSADRGNFPQPMSGDIGQIAVWNTALTASQRKRAHHAAAFSFKVSCN